MNQPQTDTDNEIKSHFAYSEHYNELPQYQGWRSKMDWKSLKDIFYRESSIDAPMYIDITNGKEVIGVYVHGFKIPETPPMIAFGSDAIIGRVALVKIATTGEFVAIRY